MLSSVLCGLHSSYSYSYISCLSYIYILIDCYQTIALRINKYSDSDSEFDFNLAE